MHPKKPAVTLLDGVILSTILGFFGFFCYRLFFALNYKWNWPVIPTYLVRFDPEQQRWVANVLLEGFFTTIRLSVWAMLFAVLLGFMVGILRVSPRLFYRLTGRTYVEAIPTLRRWCWFSSSITLSATSSLPGLQSKTSSGQARKGCRSCSPCSLPARH